MTYRTLKAAKYELAKYKQPARIAKVYRHAELCLVSDGTFIPVYPCTCKAATHVGYTIVLGGAKS